MCDMCKKGNAVQTALTSGRPAATGAPSAEGVTGSLVENAVLHGIFGGNAVSRRRFLSLAGAGGAMAAIASVFPLEAAKAFAQDPPGQLEKKDLKIGFLPINCATPIIMAKPMGFYEKHGLTGTEIVKGAGWAMVRDWAVSGQVDCAHMLAPMPLAMTLGVGAEATPIVIPTLENTNGQAIVLHKKHKDVKEARDMKGMTFCIPFDYSIHNFLLRYFLAEGGVDPDRDVKLRVVNPAEMVANLKAENVDGFIVAEPFNQRAVYEDIGFLFKLSSELWAGHPCCAFACTKDFAAKMPNTFKAVVQTMVDATLFASKAENRKEIAQVIAPRNYLNQPEEVVEQVLTGVYPDGLGNTITKPDRIDFSPFPWNSMAVWILTQMKRWGYIQGDVDYRKVAEQVFLAADCRRVMEEMGQAAPASGYAKHVIMGREFDPAEPEKYLQSFAIKHA
jgi:nitrate/nitrite transport system substrate-binding protein